MLRLVLWFRLGWFARRHHANGRRRDLKVQPVRRCHHCWFQIASASCLRCGKNYCDACWHNVHRTFMGEAAEEFDLSKAELKRKGKYGVPVKWKDHKRSYILHPCTYCGTQSSRFWCQRFVNSPSYPANCQPGVSGSLANSQFRSSAAQAVLIVPGTPCRFDTDSFGSS